MSKQMNNEIITEAKPHTIKKFELIERYVDEWARKILGYDGKDGREGSKGIIYIDCMSNSGVTEMKTEIKSRAQLCVSQKG